MVVLVVLVDEELEIGEFFGGEDEGFGVDAGFEGVHGGSGLACYGGGAGRFLGITLVRFYLTKGGHVCGSGVGRRKACPTLRIERRLGGFGGGWL